MAKSVRILTALFVLLASTSSVKYITIDNGFDKMCQIYTEVFTNSLYINKSLIEKHDVVYDMIRENVWDVDVIQAFTAVANADPDVKYDLFKQSAEYSLNREWECEIMKDQGN